MPLEQRLIMNANSAIFTYSFRIRENVDQHNSKYGHFSLTALEVFYKEDLRTAVSTDYGVSDRHGGHQFNTFVPNSSINKLSPNVCHTTLHCLQTIIEVSSSQLYSLLLLSLFKEDEGFRHWIYRGRYLLTFVPILYLADFCMHF